MLNNTSELTVISRQKAYGKDRVIVKNFRYAIVDKGEETVADLFIYDEISAWWGVNKQDILNQLKDNKVSKINLHISSLGGDVDHALAIKQLIKGHPAHVTAYLSGFVASSATIIMLAADEIKMSEDALVLIHNVSTGIWGNKESLRKLADEMETIDGVLIDMYMKKTGKSSEEIAAQMEKEEWLDANTAYEFGLVDEVVESIVLVASMKHKFSDANYYKNFKIKSPDMQVKALKFHGKGTKPTVASVLTAKVKAAAKAQNKTEDEIINHLSEESLIPVKELKAIMKGATEFSDTKGKKQTLSDSELSVFAEVLEFDAKLFTDETVEEEKPEEEKPEPDKEGEEEKEKKIEDAIQKAVKAAFAANKGKDIDQATIAAAISKELKGTVSKFQDSAALKIANLQNSVDEQKEANKGIVEKMSALAEELKEIKGGKTGGAAKKAGAPFDFSADDLAEENSDKALARMVNKNLSQQ